MCQEARGRAQGPRAGRHSAQSGQRREAGSFWVLLGPRLLLPKGVPRISRALCPARGLVLKAANVYFLPVPFAFMKFK